MPNRSTTPSVRLAAALITAIAVIIGFAGCSTDPQSPAGSSAGAERSGLREGPQTATIAESDVRPITPTAVPVLPVTVPSVGGGDVTVTKADRIIAIDRNGTLGNIAFSLGLGSRVVGRDQSTTFAAAQRLPVVTSSGHQVNVESVLSLNPSVVIADEDTPGAALDQLRAAKVTVVEFGKVRTVESTPGLITAVAAALGVPTQGKSLADRTTSEIDRAKGSFASTSPKPKIAFLYIRGPRLQLLAGPQSGVNDLIANLGGTNAGAQAGLTADFTAITAEAMIQANPDVALVMTQGAESVGGLDGVLKLPGIAQTNAGKARRVVQMDETELLAFGPDTGLVLAALAKAIYP